MPNKLKMHYAYKTTNLINNKVYFGKHTQSFGKIDNYFVNDISITNDIKNMVQLVRIHQKSIYNWYYIRVLKL